MATGRPTGRFARADRLLDARDFRRVLRHGRRRSCPELVVFSMKRRSETPLPGGTLAADPSRRRLGITTGRKAGSAVVRNRFRRRVRAWFRERRGELEPGTDWVVIARRPGTRLDYAALDARLGRLLDLPTNPDGV